MSDPCVCDDPPSVANGAATYTGSYINQTRAEYDCDSGYTNTGGSSLTCQVYESDCSNNTWLTDDDDPTSGTPNCEYVTEDIDNYNNTYNNGDGSDTDMWVLIGVAIAVFVFLLLLILLLLWWFCCRECCRRCCINGCPCCRNCCYEIPYAKGYYGHHMHSQPAVVYNDHPRQQVRTVRVSPEPVHQTIIHREHPPPTHTIIHRDAPPTHTIIHTDASPQPVRHTIVHKENHTRVVETNHLDISPETYRKRYGYYPRGYAHPSAVDVQGEAMSHTSDGLHPREYVQLHDEKLEGKPVDSRGQPVWMPHSHQVRQHLKTSTK